MFFDCFPECGVGCEAVLSCGHQSDCGRFGEVLTRRLWLRTAVLLRSLYPLQPFGYWNLNESRAVKRSAAGMHLLKPGVVCSAG